MKKSPILTLQWKDVLKGAITAALTAIVTGLYTSINKGELPQNGDWKTIGLAGGTAFLGYLLKNWLTNSSDQFAKGEQSKTL